MSRVVVITGGGTGIGAACARLMAAAGETVFITGRRLAPLQALAEETGAMPPAAMSGRLICCRRFSNARAISTF